MDAPREFWLAPRRCAGDSMDTLHDTRPPCGEVTTYVRKDIPAARIAKLEAELAKAREDVARLREYYDAVEAVDADGYSHKAILRINRARATLQEGEG